MALFAYNKTGAPLALAAGGVTLPASAAPPARGPAYNVTSELQGLSAGEYTSLEAQRSAGDVEFAWDALPEFAVGSLIVYAATVEAAPVASIVYRPGATGSDAPGGNVYTSWPLVMDAIDRNRNRGLVFLQFDPRFAPASPTGVTVGQFNPCLIPAGGPYDMRDVVWTQYYPAGVFDMGIEFEDGSQVTNLQKLEFNDLDLIYNGTVGPSPIQLPYGLLNLSGFSIRGSGIAIYNTVGGALPMFRVTDPDPGPGSPDGLITFEATFGGFGRFDGATRVLSAPVVEISGASARLTMPMAGNVSFADNWITGDGRFSPRMADAGPDGRQEWSPGWSGFGAGTSNPTFTGRVDGFGGDSRFDAKRDRLTSTITANGSASLGRRHLIDTSGGAFRLDLPTAHSNLRDGLFMRFTDIGGNVSVANLTLRAAVGDRINGSAVETGAGESDTAFSTDYGTITATQVAARADSNGIFDAGASGLWIVS